MISSDSMTSGVNAMNANEKSGNTPERRSEIRSVDERYYSVQFTTQGLASFYQFKLWNISKKGMCILVKEGSQVLEHLKVGDTIEMTYYLTDSQGAHENLTTQIKHITKNEKGRFQGHYMVGLSIS
jgi:CRISPR/Cas system-associated protein Cas7 (RAMP superfamily)